MEEKKCVRATFKNTIKKIKSVLEQLKWTQMEREILDKKYNSSAVISYKPQI